YARTPTTTAARRCCSIHWCLGQPSTSCRFAADRDVVISQTYNGHEPSSPEIAQKFGARVYAPEVSRAPLSVASAPFNVGTRFRAVSWAPREVHNLVFMPRLRNRGAGRREVAPLDPQRIDRRSGRRIGSTAAVGRPQVERSVRTLLVEMADVDAEDLLELAPTEDQQPVEALPADASDPA